MSREAPPTKFELPVRSPAPQPSPRRCYRETNRELWPVLDFRRPSDKCRLSPAKLGCDGGLSLQAVPVRSGKEVASVSTHHQYRRPGTPASPGATNWSHFYCFSTLIVQDIYIFLIIWGTVELNTLTISTVWVFSCYNTTVKSLFSVTDGAPRTVITSFGKLDNCSIHSSLFTGVLFVIIYYNLCYNLFLV